MGDPVMEWNAEGTLRAACAAIVPTRSRPGELAELLEVFGDTAVCTDLVVCLDDDDPFLNGYKHLMTQPRFTRHRVSWYVGPRQGLVGWTNQVAAEVAPRYEALISLGDDHRPGSPAWDRKLLAVARRMGGGWVYGDDGVPHQSTPDGWVTSRLPTAFLVTAPIVRALGWMLYPDCRHMFVDAIARDLGLAAGTPGRPRLAYEPHVKVWHQHWTTGLAVNDQTYEDGQASWGLDEQVYRGWLAGEPGQRLIDKDAETVRRACGQADS